MPRPTGLGFERIDKPAALRWNVVPPTEPFMLEIKPDVVHGHNAFHYAICGKKRKLEENNIKVIITSPYFTASSSDVVSKQTGAKTLVLATSVGAFDSIKNYYDLFDYNIKLLTAGLK